MATPDSPNNLLNQSVICAVLLSALLETIRQWRSNKEISIDALWPKMMSGGSIPTAILLIASPFFPSVLEDFSEYPMYLAAAGIVLLVISIKETFSRGRR
jgi:hypothetical protein